MKGVKYFTPNTDTHPAFAEELRRAAKAGVRVIAYDCDVTEDSIRINSPVKVVLGEPILEEAAEPVVEWFRANKRDLPWRKRMDAYRVWISEIMLQQTRVEAVKPYYERFIRELPDVRALAEVPEDRLLKLWEGLGYYSRARNLKKAAVQIMEEFGGKFPDNYDDIRSLQGDRELYCRGGQFFCIRDSEGRCRRQRVPGGDPSAGRSGGYHQSRDKEEDRRTAGGKRSPGTAPGTLIRG